MEISAVTAAVKSSQISINMIETLLCYFICLLNPVFNYSIFLLPYLRGEWCWFSAAESLTMSVFQRQTGLNPWNGTHGKGPILSWQNVNNFNFSKLLQSWCSGNPQTGQKLHWDHLGTSEMFLRTNWSSCVREKKIFLFQEKEYNYDQWPGNNDQEKEYNYVQIFHQEIESSVLQGKGWPSIWPWIQKREDYLLVFVRSYKGNVLSFLAWEDSKRILKAARSSTDLWENTDPGTPDGHQLLPGHPRTIDLTQIPPHDLIKEGTFLQWRVAQHELLK